MPPADRPPGEVAAGSITLVRYHGGETPALLRAVSESVDHLRPWMPWTAEAPTVQSQGEFVLRAIGQWQTGESFGYWMRENTTGALVGGCGLHARLGPDAIEIGYWVHRNWTRRGYATSAARALTTAGLALAGIGRVEIRCDEANHASASVPRRLGYRLDRVMDDLIDAPGETGRKMVWVMEVDTWAALSLAAPVP
jgi:RimJ/RimL family protein N-acetyltransferase